MNSFNILNGVPATGNAFLQRDILKGAWDFDGFVVSDWGSIMEMVPHGFAADNREAAKHAANAGSDMDMESYAYVNELVSLVEEGLVDEALIDDAARRILRVKYELGLFDDPYRYCDEAREAEVIGNPEFQDDVLDMAKKSIVLLKNETQLLPLKRTGQKIAVIGALAAEKNSPLGSWRIASKDSTAVSLLEGLQSYPENQITYAKGVDVTEGPTAFVFETKINETDRSDFDSAIAAARSADVVIMALGEHGFQSGEGRSRTEIDLPGLQQELLEEVYKVNKNIVLVLFNGRPLAINWAAEHVPSIVEAWQLGSQSGNAIAQVLYGDYNPSGKLPMTFPRSVGQIPIYYNHMNTGRPVSPGPELVFWSHYIDQTNDPLYPFGYGLSYSNFEYANISVENDYGASGVVKVSVDLTNSGTMDGKEVVQLYIHDMHASVARPVRELKGFELVELSAGEQRTITFELTEEELGFYLNDGSWTLENGRFKVFVGGNSVDTLTSEFEI
jgi:beta-glucosidase